MGQHRVRALSAGLIVIIALSGCASDGSDAPSADGGSVSRAGDQATATNRQTAFRIRLDSQAGLNDHGGWAAAMNRPATVEADQPFRIRFEVEAGHSPAPRRFALQYRRNEGPWQALLAEDFPYPSHQVEREPGALDRALESDWMIEEGSVENLQRMPEGETGALRIRTQDSPFRAWASTDIEWTPSEFGLEFRLPDKAENLVGLIFEQLGDEGYSLIEFGPAGRARVIGVDGVQRRVLAETVVDLPADAWLELTIELDGSEWIAELQDQVLFDWPQSRVTPTQQRLGVLLAPGAQLDIRRLAIEGEASTPGVSITSSPAFEHGSATEDLLTESDLPFGGGAGLSLRSQAPAWTAPGQHGEWAVPIVIRRFADEAAMNEAGDRFDFRLVDEQGHSLPAINTASVTLIVPDGHLGGTFVETPMRLGPWQSETGDLYFIIEPSETWNRMMMVRSADAGRTWREVDGAGRPATGDLEGLASVYVDGRVHIVHQISEAVFYHAFDPAGGGGAWVVRDELIAEVAPPPTQVTDLAVRSDGSIVAVYGAGDSLHYSIRSPEGEWSEGIAIPGPAGTVVSGPTVVMGRDGVVHLGYTASNGTAWARRIDTRRGLSDAVLIADTLGTGEEDVGALLPMLTVGEDRTLVLIYRTRDGHLIERRSAGDDRWSEPVIVTDRVVVQSPVDSDQVGADAIAIGDAVHVVFIEAETGILLHTVGRGSQWSTPEAIVTGANVQWVRGQPIATADGKPAYGIVYDAGSNGGSGLNRFLSITTGPESPSARP
jgi:hypothetical protein